MQGQINRLDIWEQEFKYLHCIPSSTRTLPSKALCIVEPLIDLPPRAEILDAGCGNGRNAVYLAKRGHRVVAIDFSPAALDATDNLTAQAHAQDRISLKRTDLLAPLPFENDRFGLCLDSYVSCHFVEQHGFEQYWKELTRITRPSGLIFSSMFSTDDEYYAMLAMRNRSSYPLVTDPANNITKRIYDEREFKSLFAPPLSIVNFIKFQFSDNVLGQDYRRSLFVALLRRLE
jgi:SAM-dependent methyltransferase